MKPADRISRVEGTNLISGYVKETRNHSSMKRLRGLPITSDFIDAARLSNPLWNLSLRVTLVLKVSEFQSQARGPQ